MNTPQFDSTRNVLCGITELVRGQDVKFLDEMKPLASCQSVRLDLSLVERIDAAGLAALITLYCAAHSAGNRFTVVNPSPHVAEILGLVGLSRVLLSQNADGFSFSGMEFEKTAA